MLLIRGNHPSKKYNQKPAAVTIGNFDGLHLGHQYIFNSMDIDIYADANKDSDANKNPLLKVLITFEPRPQDYFNKTLSKTTQPDRLTLLSDKLNLLAGLGFDLVWVINFNSKLANKTASEFVHEINQVLQIKDLYVGSDFKFGKNRTGDLKFLSDQAQHYYYNLHEIKNHQVNNIRVSSSHIRKLCLDAADFDSIKQFLGRNYGFTGKVLHGQQKGRMLGFPTINIQVKPRQLKLPRGVYAVNILHNNKKYSAMANWGVRPTVAQKMELVLEAHIFDFNQDIYEDKVTIEFITKIRDEKKFNSLQELQHQLSVDQTTVKNLLKN